jgi:hypothetical protein
MTRGAKVKKLASVDIQLTALIHNCPLFHRRRKIFLNFFLKKTFLLTDRNIEREVSWPPYFPENMPEGAANRWVFTDQKKRCKKCQIFGHKKLNKRQKNF